LGGGGWRGKSPNQLHVVYASSGTIAAYRRDKRFPDGSVLVKEVSQTATGPMNTGIVSRAQKLKGWFVMVKDSKDSHAGNGLVGDGWAWSWFDAYNDFKNHIDKLQSELSTCHVPARATDLIYVQGYPSLERAH
jgi:cytochrome P460